MKDGKFEFDIAEPVFVSGRIDAMYKDEKSGEHYRVLYFMDTLFDEEKSSDSKRLISDWIPESEIYGVKDYFEYLEDPDHHKGNEMNYKKAVKYILKKTNFDRIKAMSPSEFINFLRLSDFNRIHPIIEGRQFFDNNEVIAWLKEEAKDDRKEDNDCACGQDGDSCESKCEKC